MATNNIFAIDPDVLDDFDVKSGTALIGSLLRCEATRLGLPMQKVVISSRTSTKDGGVDAKVEDVPAGAALLKKGSSYFQIKTGTSFKPWLRKHLVKELFGKVQARPAKGHLGKEVKRCLDKKGRYVLVTLGHDLLPEQHSDAEAFLLELLGKAGYKNARVEVVGQGQLVGALGHYPSLCLDVQGLGEVQFLTMRAWAERADMQPKVQLGDPQQQFLSEIREGWRGQPVQHLRIVGEPGIGKTRLVLEAASAPDLAPATLYVPHAEDFQRSALFNELLKPDRDYTANLVIDECEEQERASIWGALKGKPHIKLITIDHGPETASDSAMQIYKCPALGKDEITAILSGYLGKRGDLSNWAEWCEGSPRVGHAVGDNLKRNPQDILKSPAIVPIWDRFIMGHKRFDSRTASEHFSVLRHLALFQRFGFEDPVSEEAQFISRLVEEADPNITWARFQSIVRHHQGRRILQGRHTLFIVPKALHVHLWVQFWDEHGLGFNFQKFMERLPDGLKNWFLRLFIYAHASPVAQSVVKKILSPSSGPFVDRAFLQSDVGTRLLDYLAEADPPATLQLLEHTFGQWPLDELRAWSKGRQDIVWALEKIAVWKDLFPRAATILARMALAENASNSNNSKGILEGLFIVGLGWAATQAPPQLRFPILERLVKSATPAERALGLELCKEWLSTSGGGRVVGAEYQGARPTLEFWHPAIWQEIFDAWMSVWRFLHTEIKKWADLDRRASARVLVDVGMSLVSYRVIAAEVLETLFELADDVAVDKAQFVAAVVRALRHPAAKYPRGIRQKLKALDKKLTGTSFRDRFSRFVLFTTWDEDHLSKGDVVTDDPLPKRRVEKLASEAARNDGLLRSHLSDWVSCDGHRLPDFGHALARQLTDNRWDDEIFAALKREALEANSAFIGGYLSAVREADVPRWETFILNLLADAELRIVGVNATFRSGISSAVTLRLLSLYQAREVGARALSRIGVLARLNGIPQSLVDETVAALTERNEDEAIDVCIELVDQYYCRNELPLPNPQVSKLIRAAVALEPSRNAMRDFYLHRIVKRYRVQYPREDLELLSALLSNFDGLSRLRGPYDLSLIADDIVRSQPAEAWGIIESAIEIQLDRAYNIVMWLGDGGSAHGEAPGAMRLLNPDDIIRWTQAKPAERLRLIYHGLPKTLEETKGGRVTQLFIEEFGDRDAVSGALVTHFAYNGAWAGPRSAYLRRKRDEARGWLSSIRSDKVEQWATRYIGVLTEDISRAEIEEERGF